MEVGNKKGSNMKRIAIIVRSRNDIAFAEHTLSAIRSQSVADFSVHAFDNASTDGTRKVLENYNIEIIDIPEGAYVPGKTLNLAVSKVQADIYVFNNLDAVPQNSNWLKNLIAPVLNGDADISYARQTARKDALLWVRSDYAHAFPNGDAVSPEFFSMASSCVSAKVFEKINFDESLKFSEDVMLVKTARENNFKIVYVPSAVAEHSHNYDSKSIVRRFTGEGVADSKIYGGKFTLLDAFRRIVSDSIRDIFVALKSGKIAQIPSAIKARYLQKMSYYKGRKGDK